ncbi:MAG TPA: DUF2339 domain-containing protein [Candidatus Eremiobacteraceae bacterium]|nr:DUF2339 domain-containing protein [Candidatus Eremiobacteraceae bacterium]
MDEIFGIFAVLIVGLLLISWILGVFAFARTYSLQRDIDALRREILIRDRPEPAAQQAPEPPPVAQAPPPVTQPPPVVAPVLRAFDPLPLPQKERRATDEPVSTPRTLAPRPDFEAVVGGKWLNVIGLAAVLIATAFGLKYAFDENWIGPYGRIALGFVAGSAVLAASEWILRRGWIYFSEGVTALGAGILFLSLYAAWNFYHIIPPEAAFIGLAAVTGLLIAISLGRNSQRIAALALLGGYATPLLVSTGHDAQVPLFTYLALLNIGLVWMVIARDWRTLSLSFLFSALYGATWYAHFYDSTKLMPSLIFASIFFLQFALLPAIVARRRGGLLPDGVAMALVNAAWYLIILDRLLYDSHRWLLTASVLAAGAFFIIISSLVPVVSDRSQTPARPVFGSIAFAFVTAAIPIRLQGQWIDMAWAIEGALLVWSGLRSDTRWLRWNGVAVLTIVSLYLFLSPLTADRAFLNGRFATFAVVVAALAAVRFLSRRYAAVPREEEVGYRALGIAANFFAVYALSTETLQALRPSAVGPYDLAPIQQYGLTIVFALYALVLAAFARAADSKLVRWQSWILFALVLLKAPSADFAADLHTPSELIAVRFWTFLLAAGAMALGLYFTRTHKTPATGVEHSIFSWFEVAINVYSVWALTVVAAQAFAIPAVYYTAEWNTQQILAVTVAWTAYALGLAIFARVRGSNTVRWQAWALFALIALKAPATDFSTSVAPHTALTLIRIAVFVFVFAAMLCSLLLVRDRAAAGKNDRLVLRCLDIALNVYGVWALSLIVWQAYAGPPASTEVSWSAAQQLGLSLVWTVYAVALIAIGTWRDSAVIRWQALALFGFVILKAFLFDLSMLALGYRIASFFALGVMLLGASFLYQRRLFRRRPPEAPR